MGLPPEHTASTFRSTRSWHPSTAQQRPSASTGCWQRTRPCDQSIWANGWAVIQRWLAECVAPTSRRTLSGKYRQSEAEQAHAQERPTVLPGVEKKRDGDGEQAISPVPR